MRRFALYIFISFLTFSVGLLLVNFFRQTKKILPAKKETKAGQKENLSNKKTYYDFFSKEKVQSSRTESQEKAKLSLPFCRDKRILPVWKLLLKEERFSGWGGEVFEFEEPNCANMLEVLYFDLNQDGKNEILLRGKTVALCGGVGNCGFWIFEKKGRRYRKILFATDYIDITKMGNQIRREKTRGYFNILLKGHINASDTSHTTYKFNGRKYVESRCLVDFYIRGTSPNIKSKFISCPEFYERWAREK